MTMRVDAYTHFIPNRFYKEVMSAGSHKDIGKRMMGVPAIYDLNVRKKVVDKFKDYNQILSYPMPPFELMTKSGKQTEEYAKIVNDGFAEICAKDPDHFPGWVAQAPMAAPDVGVREAARAMKMGALGVQIYTNVAGRPLDNPEFEPFWKAMNKTKHADLAASVAHRELLGLPERDANPSTKSGGRSAGPTRPPPRCRGSCSPRSWTAIRS